MVAGTTQMRAFNGFVCRRTVGTETNVCTGNQQKLTVTHRLAATMRAFDKLLIYLPEK